MTHWFLRDGIPTTLIVARTGRGRYEVTLESRDPSRRQRWTVWRGINGRWYGHSAQVPEKMVDAPTLHVAKVDIQNGRLIECAVAGT